MMMSLLDARLLGRAAAVTSLTYKPRSSARSSSATDSGTDSSRTPSRLAVLLVAYDMDILWNTLDIDLHVLWRSHLGQVPDRTVGVDDEIAGLDQRVLDHFRLHRHQVLGRVVELQGDEVTDLLAARGPGGPWSAPFAGPRP